MFFIKIKKQHIKCNVEQNKQIYVLTDDMRYFK